MFKDKLHPQKQELVHYRCDNGLFKIYEAIRMKVAQFVHRSLNKTPPSPSQSLFPKKISHINILPDAFELGRS